MLVEHIIVVLSDAAAVASCSAVSGASRSACRAASTQPVYRAAVGDADQPRTERPRRIVGVPDRMEGEQDVLHCIFDVPMVLVPSSDQ